MNSVESIMLLKLYAADNGLREKYLDAIVKHNDNDSPFFDSGFDLFIQETLDIVGGTTHKINCGVKCSAFWLNRDMTVGSPTAFYVYPRSSISKTPLRLANSVGIIDSGYRGNLIGMVDCNSDYQVIQFSRLFQICSPTLGRIKVVIVGSEGELGQTDRGDGGFGSTGI